MSNTSYPPHVNNILRICPFRYPISYATTWYTLPSVPDFRVCNRCYSEKLASTPFANKFVGRVEPAGEERYCNFLTPRVHALLAACLASGDSSPLESYIRTRVAFKKCPGPSEISAVDKGISWHKLDAIHGGLDACQACYNDYVVSSKAGATLNTSYPTHAMPVAQAADQGWTCDMACIYAQRAARTAHTWPQLRQALEEAARQPQCEGFKPVPASSRQWFRLRRGVVPNFLACEACFRNYAAASDMAVNWEAVPLPGDVSGSTKMTCMLAHPVLQFAYLLAFVEKDLAIFVRSAAEVLVSPLCRPEGIQDPSCDWYGLPQVSGKDFAVCGGCFAGLVKPWGTMDRVFTRIPPPKASSERRVCDLNLGNPRFLFWYRHLSEATEKNEPQIFVDRVVKNASLKPCPRSKPTDAGGGRKWWGNDEFLACETCAVDTISGSTMEPMMRYKGTSLPGQKKCDLYSPRTRKLWSECISNPDRNAGMNTFSSKMREREMMYQQTYVQVQKGIAHMEEQTRRHIQMMDRAVAMQGLDMSMQTGDYIGGSSYSRIGNNTHGYWASQMGYDAARQFQNGLTQQVIDPNLTAQLQMLEQKWKEYE
ncbi:hypothetical protein MKZ38_004544 [Zalerion maritima]|uniref:Integral membrane protein n=1 Tax=Zalerion maritima TaxID=339359 RepID=A0AAD5WPT9_9PEZI|nr:hypothetical protein MKZ38_004544 [Zalerion maritima]